MDSLGLSHDCIIMVVYTPDLPLVISSLRLLLTTVGYDYTRPWRSCRGYLLSAENAKDIGGVSCQKIVQPLSG